jgi:hypothetical protein
MGVQLAEEESETLENNNQRYKIFWIFNKNILFKL